MKRLGVGELGVRGFVGFHVELPCIYYFIYFLHVIRPSTRIAETETEISWESKGAPPMPSPLLNKALIRPN